MIRTIVLLIVTVALMSSARSFMPQGDVPVHAAGVALGFGFLLLAAIQTGNLFAAIKLPRLTGYLLTGLVCGPQVSGLLTEHMVDGLGLVNGVAVGLIALSAGCEINLAQIRPRLRTIIAVGGVAMPLAIFAATVVALAFSGLLPFMSGLSFVQRLAVAVTLGVVFASLSPSVALAILAETASQGPVTESVLGVVVLADIVIIILFTVVHAVASGVFGSVASGMSPARQVLIEVFGSMLVGGAVGGALAVYIRRVQTKVALFVLAVCLIAAQVGSRLHLDVLIICLVAGLLLENAFGVRGESVTHQLGPAVLPVFAVFFGVAGARLHLDDLAQIWPLAILFAVVRGVTLFVGAKIGTSIAGTDPHVRRWMPFGVFPQAGVSVGLAVLIERHFPTWGPGARALILSEITVNELVGPVLLRFALVRAGEAGKRTDMVAVDH